MIVGTIYLISLLFATGISPFSIPFAKENILKVIEDDSRKKEAKTIIKSFEKTHKAYLSTTKRQQKTKRKLNADFNATNEAIEQLFIAAKKERIAFAKQLINTRIQLQKLITEDEWEILTKNISLKIKKNETKFSKKEIENSLKENKKLQEAKIALLAIFENESKQKKAAIYFESFEKNIVNHLYIHQNYLNKMLSLAKDKNTSKEALLKLINEKEKFRSEIGLSFITMRKDLIQLSTEKQWIKISKNISKLIL